MVNQRVRRTAAFAVLMAALAAGLAAACAPSAQVEGPTYAATPLAENVLMVSSTDGNVVVGVAPEGLVVFDGGPAEHAQALKRFLLKETGAKRIATLIDSTWLPERTGLNEIVGAEGGTIVSHFNARQWLTYGAEARPGVEAVEALPEPARPTRFIYDEGGSIPFGVDSGGDGAIELGYLLQARTDADLYAYFPDANVLAAGAGVSSDAWPMIEWRAGGYLGGQLDAWLTLLEVADEDTIIVPGHGPVMSYADLEAGAAMYDDMFHRMADLVLSAHSPAESVAVHPTGEYHPDWPDADAFVERAHRSYETHLRRDPRLNPVP
jgi:cyclase